VLVPRHILHICQYDKVFMPLIKPRTRGKKFVRLVTGLDRESHETLYACAQFIGETAEYVLNQLVETLLANDKEFVALRAEHPDSHVPLPGPRTPKAEPGHGGRSRTAIVPGARGASAAVTG